MTAWLQTVVSVALLAAYAVSYGMRAATLRRRGRPVPVWRLACFTIALLELLVVAGPVVDRLADENLSVHMFEHVVIGDLAPLLLVLGLTGPLLAPVLRTPAARLRPLTHPVVAFALWTASLYLWHLRGAYESAVRHDLVHVLEHACFFAFGANLWFALLGPLPKPAWFGTGAKLAYVVGVNLVGAGLAYTFAWSGVVLYPVYGIADQGAAGGVMLVEQSVVIVGLFAWLLWRAIEDAERRQVLAERAQAAGIALDRRRIARAVTADGGEALRRRLEAESRSAE